MFTSIKTSKENKELVSQLTRRLNLGAENTIARLAFACSIAAGKKLDLEEIEDAQGKEYSAKVLFGEFIDIYVAMICVNYDIHKSNKNIPRYVKMHLDHGLRLISDQMNKKDSMSGMEFIINNIEKGLRHVV
jgi:DNA sulfur modification protein DndE